MASRADAMSQQDIEDIVRRRKKVTADQLSRFVGIIPRNARKRLDRMIEEGKVRKARIKIHGVHMNLYEWIGDTPQKENA